MKNDALLFSQLKSRRNSAVRNAKYQIREEWVVAILWLGGSQGWFEKSPEKREVTEYKT
ncbi:hypothetical protein QA601_17570 [Chitinispirillales bacterium ANBcel5]|uniref:hypothetical protein n=1 Tax=Cellulosispirillum alkaliphilum TaxID=3039283 RepID=UPI002A54A360|nr:hypothetical protein [Chitinispirillales bacterium ANBcel5]